MENEALINEFMGLKACNCGCQGLINPNGDLILNFGFGNDWQSLMEIVTKISNIKRMNLQYTLEDICCNGWDDAEDIYNGIIGFIKEYNKTRYEK